MAQVAVCNLASIALPAFVEGDSYDFKKLYEAALLFPFELGKSGR